MKHQPSNPPAIHPDSNLTLSWDDVFILPTQDGSDTLYHRRFESYYHSMFGAVSESKHVFIQHGLATLPAHGQIHILELGFGTGLNAFLAFLVAIHRERQIHYCGIESCPIDMAVVSKLNYPDYLAFPEERDIYYRMHMENAFVTDNFHFEKLSGLDGLKPERLFHCIFFDAFSPVAQPELWDQQIFERMFALTAPGGCLVTYCAQGEVRRRMIKAGYTAERLPGPPGKREMLRASKPASGGFRYLLGNITINMSPAGSTSRRIRFFNNLRTMKFNIILLIWMCGSVVLTGQQEFHAACIAFYNVENLFDTLDSPDTDDLEFTPMGSNSYTGKVYYEKLEKLAGVVSEIGTSFTPDGAVLLGVAEVENISVLEDFVKQPAIASRGYKILHQDSKDGRGVDIALLYQPAYFTPEHVHYYALPLHEAGEEPRYSRDILIATGTLLGERIAVSVNHWPSRRGGAQATAHLRDAAAAYNRHYLDSLSLHAGITQAIVMGDFNDDPVNISIRKHLRSQGKKEKMNVDDMYNPFEAFYKKGLGTTAYQDAWSLFDQIVLSYDLAEGKSGWRFHKAGVYNPPYLTQSTGPFKGYPLRTYANGAYIGGYSDHFPVYVLLVKPRT